MALNDISEDDYNLFGRLFVCGLIKTLRRFHGDFVPFWYVDAKFRERGFDYEQQTMIMKKLAAAGFFEHINFQGWRLLEPAHADDPGVS